MLGLKKIADVSGWKIETVWERYKDSNFTPSFQGSFDIDGDKNAIYLFEYSSASRGCVLTINGKNELYGKAVVGVYGSVAGGTGIFYIPDKATIEITGGNLGLQNIHKLVPNKIRVLNIFTERVFSGYEKIIYDIPSHNFDYILGCLGGTSRWFGFELLDENGNYVSGFSQDPYKFTVSGIFRLYKDIVNYVWLSGNPYTVPSRLNAVALIK